MSVRSGYPALNSRGFARGAWRLAASVIVFAVSVLAHGRTETAAEAELRGEIAQLQRAMGLKLNDDITMTATSLSSAADISFDNHNVVVLGAEILRAYGQARGIAASAVSGLVGFNQVVGPESPLLQFTRIGVNTVPLDYSFWRRLLRESVAAKAWSALVSGFDAFGSALVNVEMVAEAAFAMDAANRELFSDLYHAGKSGAHPQIVAEDFLKKDRLLNVRRANATWPRTFGTPYPCLNDVLLRTNEAFRRIDSLVADGLLPPEDVPRLASLVRTLRAEIVKSRVEPRVVVYPGPYSGQPQIGIPLGEIGALNRHFESLTEANLKGMTSLERRYRIEAATEIGGAIVGGVFKHAEEVALFPRKADIGITVKEIVAGKRYTKAVLIDATGAGVSVALSAGAELATATPSAEDLLIETAAVRVELQKAPIHQMYALPREFSRAAALVTDLEAIFSAAKKSPPVSTAPAAATLAVPSPVVLAVKGNAAGITVTVDGKTTLLPATISAVPDRALALEAPERFGPLAFRGWSLNGRLFASRTFSFVPGEGEVTAVYGEAVVVATTSGSAPSLTGPDTVEAGTTATYSVVGLTAGSSSVLWSTSHESVAPISAGVLHPIAGLPHAQDVLVFAQGAGLTTRLEKKVRLEPRKAGGGYHTISTRSAEGLVFSLSPDPSVSQNGFFSYPAGSTVEVSINLSPGFVLGSLGDETLPLNQNPLRLVMNRDYVFQPQTKAAAAVQGLRTLRVSTPGGVWVTVAGKQARLTLKPGETELKSSQFETDETPSINVKTASPLYEFVDVIGGRKEPNGDVPTRLIHDLHRIVRVRPRLKSTEAERKRSVDFELSPNVLDATANLGGTDNGKIELASATTLEISFYAADRPQGSPAYRDAWIRIPSFRGFPEKVLRATLILHKLNSASDRGGIKLMRTEKAWLPGVVSRLPEVSDYPGAPSADLTGRTTAELDVTEDINNRISTGWVIRSTVSKWPVYLATASHGNPALRPVLRLEFIEPEAPESAPLLVERTPDTELSASGATKLSAKFGSDTAVRYAWERNGVAVAGATAAALEVTQPGTYRLTATNAVGATTVDLTVNPPPEQDAPNLLLASTVVVANASGVATLAGTVRDTTPVSVSAQSPTIPSAAPAVTTGLWALPLSVPPGRHNVNVVAVDNWNNSSRAVVQVVNAALDKTAPLVTTFVEPLPISGFQVQYEAVDDVGLQRVELIVDGEVVETVRLPEPTGMILSSRALAENSTVSVRAFDFAGRSTLATAEIRKARQTIGSLPVLPSGSVTLPFKIAIDASTTSGLPVTAAVVSGAATLIGKELSIVGAGEVVLELQQPGNGFWEPSVVRLSGPITVAAPATPAAPPAPPAAPPPTTVPAPPATIPVVSSPPTPAIPGSVPVVVTSPKPVVVTPPPIVSIPAPIAVPDPRPTGVKLSQRIDFRLPDRLVASSAPLPLSATATSGLPVAYTVFSGAAHVVGKVLVLSGSPGTVVVEATQPGDERFAAAEPVRATILIEPEPGQLVNLSARLLCLPRQPCAIGFVLRDGDAGRLLVRAIGPGLRAYGITTPIAEPSLEVFDRTGAVVAANRGWSDNAEVSQMGDLLGAFKLAPGARDSALVRTLAPGAYTAGIGTGEEGGIVLFECYGSRDSGELVNISVLGQVSSADPVIAGFAISGGTPMKLLIRAVGPHLRRFGVDQPASDPVLRVIRAGGTAPIHENDNWGAPSGASLVGAFTSVGAFPLEEGSRDAAILVSLPPGVYSAIAESADGKGGTLLVEVYAVPAN